MAKELFSIAAQERKESPQEIKRRKTVILFAGLFTIAFTGHSIFLLKDFPLNIPFPQAVLIHENQVILMRTVIEFGIGLSAFAFLVFILHTSVWSFSLFFILSVLVGGVIVYSDLAGFEIVRRRGLGAAYGLCFVLPILAFALFINQRRKRRL